MPRCVILALDHSPLSSVSGPLEILLLGARLAGASDWQIEVAAEQQPTITGSGGIRLNAHTRLADVEQAELLIIAAVGDPRLRPDALEPVTLQRLQRLHQRGTRMVSICTGAFVLAAAGLLEGKQATSHWAVSDWLQQQFPGVLWQKNAMLTHDGNISCSGGASAYQDMSLQLVRDYFGESVALQVARTVLIDADRHSQLQYRGFMANRQHQDERILEVQDWLDRHGCEPFTLADLAAQIHLSERQFKRRFTQAVQQSPLVYIQSLRMEKARQALCSSRRQVEQIARDCGYDDVRFFRELFRRSTGLTPLAYRQKFARWQP
ncbi:MAG: helix-turn-helix domain-containing protein [Saccharospirillaceae bacterium]|nr:helix-turn-helix domain-containing protein [Saccharospirillaceae bacterium]MCD8531733.1 helix-turn-helix domain-containing protein [Saccharospirillaceae bacterium]